MKGIKTVTRKTKLVALSLVLIIPQVVQAEAPIIQAEGAMIHLADNLGEDLKLGWCIDTEGRGISDQLHAHSCKPAGEGGDVLFSYSSDAKTIRSVPYEGLCMIYNAPDDVVNPFGLVDCVEGDATQQFVHDAASMEIRLAADPTQCVAVAAKIDDAGPYQSRDLILVACAELEPAYKQWVIRD